MPLARRWYLLLMSPYLTGQVRVDFDAWHAGLRRRFERDLTFAEIRKGVQALSSLYVSRRGVLPGGGVAFDGEGKRAAFALYYAPLHFITTHHVVREIEFDALPVGRLWDLGCGTGAGGAAWGAALRSSLSSNEPGAGRLPQAGAGPRDPGPDPEVREGRRAEPAEDAPGRRTARSGLRIVGVDRSGFALEEAEGTYRAFHLRAETRRIDIGDSGDESPVVSIRSRAKAAGDRMRAHGGIRGDDAVLLAFTANELNEAARERLLHQLLGGEGTSRPLLVVEPITKRAAPWWSRWERALGEEALLLHSIEWRRRLELPEWIAGMDRAAGLDHSELTARVLGVVG